MAGTCVANASYTASGYYMAASGSAATVTTVGGSSQTNTLSAASGWTAFSFTFTGPSNCAGGVSMVLPWCAVEATGSHALQFPPSCSAVKNAGNALKLVGGAGAIYKGASVLVVASGAAEIGRGGRVAYWLYSIGKI